MMKALFVLLFIVGCAGTIDDPLKKVTDKKSFFAPSVKDGMEYLSLWKLQLRKIDTVDVDHRKVYIFYYKD